MLSRQNSQATLKTGWLLQGVLRESKVLRSRKKFSLSGSSTAEENETTVRTTVVSKGENKLKKKKRWIKEVMLCNWCKWWKGWTTIEVTLGRKLKSLRLTWYPVNMLDFTREEISHLVLSQGKKSVIFLCYSYFGVSIGLLI